MSRRRREALREFTAEEQHTLTQFARSQRVPAIQSRRAGVLLEVASGKSLLEASRSQGFKDGDTASSLVHRFNLEGLGALIPRHAGGPVVEYDVEAQKRILSLASSSPDLEHHGTNTWSLTTLQAVLREDGMPKISTHKIWKTLSENGLSWRGQARKVPLCPRQRSRTWCATGQARRVRQAGVVTVTDPDTEAKKS